MTQVNQTVLIEQFVKKLVHSRCSDLARLTKSTVRAHSECKKKKITVSGTDHSRCRANKLTTHSFNQRKWKEYKCKYNLKYDTYI